MLPVICCHWLSPAIVNLLTVPSAVKLKHLRVRPNPFWFGDYCFPSGCYCWEGSGLSEQDDCCIWGLAQQRDPCGYFLTSLPKASAPSLSSSLSSPLCPTLASDLLSLATSFRGFIWSQSLRLKHQRDRAENLLGLGLLFPLRLLLLRREWSA